MNDIKKNLDKLENLCSLSVSDVDLLKEIFLTISLIKSSVRQIEEWWYE